MQSTGQKAEPEWTDLGRGSAWNVGNVPSQIPQEQQQHTASSSSSSSFRGFYLRCSDNLRPFRLITLGFFHLPVVLRSEPARAGHSTQESLWEQCGACTAALIPALFPLSSGSCTAWFCPHSSSLLVGRFRDLPQTMSSCLLTAPQWMGQTEITRLALTRTW